MYRYFGFCILPVDLVFEFYLVFSLFGKSHDTQNPLPPRTQLKPRMPAASVFSSVPLKTVLPKDVLI